MIAMADMSDPFAGRPIPRQRGGGAGAVHPITEQLEIRVLDPALAQRLVREILHGLEDRQARHEPGRQRRMTGLVGIDRPEPLLKKPPVDGAGELRERVAHVHDLIEPRPEQVVLSALPSRLRLHRIAPHPLTKVRESRLNASRNLQDNQRPNRQF